ncbi:uncharacterized protein TNCV_736781 [Trichonephila clavipes]|nr:uncharacterized protein TNCV_736781 [Trichonephila clavipes]
MRKRPTMRKKVRLRSRMSDIDSQKYQKSGLNGKQPFMEICVQEKSAKEKPPLIRPPSLDGCEVKSDPKMENDLNPTRRVHGGPKGKNNALFFYTAS